MEGSVSTQAWAEQHFGSTKLKDRRRTRRLVHSAAKIALHPGQTFPQIFDWNELRGFYNLCDQPTVTLVTVQEPHWQQTLQAMQAQELVLILHDTTELDFTAHTALKGTGPIGDGRGRGFLQHNSLAVLPKPRQVLGLAHQQLRLRQPAPAGERSAQRKKRERESVLWLNGIRGVGPAPAECCWVDVGDRGSDIYEAMVTSREMGHHFLFRLTQNRQVFTTETHDQTALLRDYACTLPSQGQDVVDISGRGGRAARTAVVQLAAAPVWVPAPAGTPRRHHQPVIAAWVIRVWEAKPPAGVEALEWFLLCSLSSTTLEELKERRDWYCCRWMVEMFHDVEKNGCGEEARRFETAERMEPCLALLSVVAVRVLQLRYALESQPDEPAKQVATPQEIDVVRRITHHKSRHMTVRDFVRGVAKLGGFLGRKCDGNPGIRTLWRGYQRLQDMLLGIQLHAATLSDDG
jgi:Transposase DNA-binding/Transposase Tn5 dimerisation domain